MEENKEQKKLALGKQNLILLAIGFGLIVIGFALMLGSSSGLKYNPDIYSDRRTIFGPMTSLAGFMFIIYAILKKKK